MINVKRRRSTRSFGIDDDEDESSNGVIERRCWSDLPNDLLEPIMSKLFFIDQINLRAVCKSWHEVVLVPPPLKQMPWLMVFDDTKKGRQYSCKLVDPTYKKTYTIDMSSSINKKKNLKGCSDVKIHESKYGWLLMSCVSNKTITSDSLFLYSPFFIDNNIIELPDLSASIMYSYIATFDLSKKKKEEEAAGFEVLVLSSDTNGTICIETCRQGDNSWSCNKTNWNVQLYMIDCWVYLEGIFYYATNSNIGQESESESESGSYDIARKNWTKFPTIVRVRPHGEFNMIKFDGEIYLTYVHKNMDFIWVCIYKFDLSKGTWRSIELHDLDDRVLFIGNEYSSSILELDNDVEEVKDQRQKVYYCYSVMENGGVGYATALKLFTRSDRCSKRYGSLAQGYRACRRIWIDLPRRIKNSI